MAIEKFYHICNYGKKIIFRVEDDYLMAINRLASCAYATRAEICAYAIMSTHFHLILRTADLSSFITFYLKSINRWYSAKYHRIIDFSISQRQLTNPEELIIAINYVLKNPIHHGICEIALKYPYSSANCYYHDELDREDYYIGERRTAQYQYISELNTTIKRRLFGSQTLPDLYQVMDKKMIVPECFVRLQYIRSLYKSCRNYLFNMNKSLSEELKMLAEGASSKLCSVSLFGKLSDREVCRLIDTQIAPKRHTELTDFEKKQLWLRLKQLGVDEYQFERAM